MRTTWVLAYVWRMQFYTLGSVYMSARKCLANAIFIHSDQYFGMVEIQIHIERDHNPWFCATLDVFLLRGKSASTDCVCPQELHAACSSRVSHKKTRLTRHNSSQRATSRRVSWGIKDASWANGPTKMVIWRAPRARAKKILTLFKWKP